MGMLRALVTLLLLLFSAAAQAQQYPSSPVRVLVGYAAGGAPDIQARTIAQQLAIHFNQSFYIENKTGANGTIAARTVATSQPDGLTLLFSSSSIAPTPHIYKNLGYDTLTDLRAIATSGILDGMLMLVDAKSPIKSVPEFVAFAKANRVLYGSPGVGNVLHLAAEAFAQKAGIAMQHVPYKGLTEVMTALLGGSVLVVLLTPVSVTGLVKEGRVHALAFTETKPFPEFPDVPLMKDVLPGATPMGSWGMFYAPGKTPDATVDKLNAAIREALRVPLVAGVMQRDGYIPDNRTAAETQAFFRKEVEAMGVAVKAAKIESN